MPGAVWLQARSDGGQLRGGAPRVVWQTLETDPRLVSARSAAECLDKLGRAAHLVWNPLTGELVQLLPVLRAGCGLGGPDGLVAGDSSAGEEARTVNREGRLCVQIAVVGFARDPFTSGPMADLERIVAWLDSWRIVRRWPAGRPAAFSQAHGGPRCRRLWASGGHFGASQVPDCPATGPGEIEIEQLTGPATTSDIGTRRRTRDPLARREKAAAGPGAVPIGLRHDQEDAGSQLTNTG
jgi:hypothetical protein